MSKVFISYRRDDSQDATGRLHDRMELLLGPDVFFRDIDNIAAGDNYRSALSNALDECSVLLAIIGPSWISIADDGQTRRIDDPNDFVRIELETALSRRIHVIPVLVTFAEMPNASLLPRSLRDLGFSSKQAMHVRPSTDFLTDTNRLANRIGEIIGREVVEYKQLLCDCQRLGLVTFKKSFVEDRSVLEAIDRTGELLVVMNDGRSWVDTNQEMLARRIQSPETSNRFLFLHPSSPFIDILIQKNEKSKTTQLEEIKRSFMSLERNRRPDSNLYIRGHRLFHPYTLILTDSHAFVSTYYYNEGGALPLYKYSKEATDGLYHEFKKDAHRLFERSVDLANTDFT